MNLEAFKQLIDTEKLNEIYKVLTVSQKPGIEGLFGPDRPKTNPPVFTPPPVPEGFESVFGKEPNAPVGSPERARWDNKIRRWGGFYSLHTFPYYSTKVSEARASSLGDPIGYIFDGDVFVTFSSLTDAGLTWYRDLSQFMTYYDDMVRAANLELRNKGIIS